MRWSRPKCAVWRMTSLDSMGYLLAPHPTRLQYGSDTRQLRDEMREHGCGRPVFLTLRRILTSDFVFLLDCIARKKIWLAGCSMWCPYPVFHACCRRILRSQAKESPAIIRDNYCLPVRTCQSRSIIGQLVLGSRNVDVALSKCITPQNWLAHSLCTPLLGLCARVRLGHESWLVRWTSFGPQYTTGQWF